MLKHTLDTLHTNTKKIENTNASIEQLKKQQKSKRKTTAVFLTLSTQIKKETAYQKQLIEIREATIKGLRPTKEKIELLRKICVQFPECADALLDEVDVLLDCLQEVNFPDGNTTPVHAVRNSLLHSIYQCLVSETMKIETLEGTPTIAEVVKLKNNKQSLMSSETYKEHVIPVIAQHLADHFKPINVNLDFFTDSFIRYVTGKMPEVLQKFADDKTLEFSQETLSEEDPEWMKKGNIEDLQNDLAFLEYLDRLYTSDEKTQVEAANLIALTRHFLLELTPTTLSKSGRRNYGLSPNKKTGKIIPYLAVNTPATTEFGYHWEEACYNYQWAAAFPIDKEQIIDFARIATSAAKYYVQKNGESFNETAEYEEFGQIFGVPVDKIHVNDNLEKAKAHVSDDIKKKLDLQYETISRNVAFRTERLTSNGMALNDQLSSRRTMSGTPWNVEGYTPTLSERYEPDTGTEGKILHTLATRGGKNKIHEVHFTTINEFLGQIYRDHPAPQKIRGVIEAGGLFKTFCNNAEVAENMMQFLSQKQERGLVDKKIEGVLFFHTDPDQQQPDTLYVWRKGAKKPERIGGSSVASLMTKGLDPSKYFVYYDERHTTGTDILQIPDSINLFTFDEKMLRRTLGQGIMRLRQYLFAQDAEIVITKDARNTVMRKGKNIEDLVIHAEKIQSLRKSHDMVRYYKQQIDNIFRRQAVRMILEAALNVKKHDDFAQIVETYEPFFVSSMIDEPYLLHGKLKNRINTKQMLKNYLSIKMKMFHSHVTNLHAIKAVTQDVSLMEQHINKALTLPEKWEDTPECVGVEQEVSVLQQVTQQQEVETEVEREIELELQRYEQSGSTHLRREKGISKSEFLDLIKILSTEKPNSKNVIPLQEQLKKYDYRLLEEKVEYEKAFSEPIFGTKAYFYTCASEEVIPVFNKLQRPAKQILAVRINENEIRWLLLSEHEANDVREHLQQLYKKKDHVVDNVWLIQSDGSLLLNGKHNEEFPSGEECVDLGLLEINAFTGHADYLDKNAYDTEAWLSENSDLKIRFLKLKVAHNKKQNRILRTCPMIHKLDVDAVFDPNQQMFRARVEREKSRKGKIKPDTEVATKLLPPRKVGNLNVNFVQYLGLDWEKRKTDKVTRKAFIQLEHKLNKAEYPKGSPKREQKVRENAEKLTKDQFRFISLYQGPFITAEQIQWLPIVKVEFLDNPEQIYRKVDQNGETTIEYLLSKEQALALKEHQRNLIPFVNPEYYRDFYQKWQVESIPPEHMDKISPSQWVHLSKKQVKRITLKTIESLAQQANNITDEPISDPSQLKDDEKPFDEQHQVTQYLNKLSTPRKFGWVHGDLLPFIPRRYRNFVCSEQIQEITKSELIPRLEKLADESEVLETIEKGLWTSWITPTMVKHIDFEQLPYLKTNEQIREIPMKHVEHLDPCSQVPLISQDQVPYLKGEAQIHRIKDENFPFLTPQQIKWISDDQISLVSINQVSSLSNSQLLTVKEGHWKEIQGGLVQRQVESFDSPKLIDLLSQEQIHAWLTKEQVHFLKEEWQIQSCPDAHVKHLNFETQIPHISLDQIPFLSGKEQIQSIKDREKFERLTGEESAEKNTENQMQWIHDDLFPWITPEQVRGLSHDQILRRSTIKPWEELCNALTPSQIQSFQKQELIDLLSEEQIHKHLSSSQVLFLKKPWQIQSCPDACVKDLDLETQIIHIKMGQIPYLRGVEQIRTCPATEKHVHLLAKEAFQYLTDAQAKLLSHNQIGLMDQKIEVEKLSNDQLQHLQPKGIKQLNEEQVLFIHQNPKLYSLIQHLHPDFLPLIKNPEAVKHITDEQIDAFDNGKYNTLDGQHHLWGRITKKRVNDVDLDHIQFIPSKQLHYLKNPEKIRKVPFWKVWHLTPKQLIRKGSWKQLIVYTIGVVILAVAACVATLLGSIALARLILSLIKHPKSRLFLQKNRVQSNQLYHFFASIVH